MVHFEVSMPEYSAVLPVTIELGDLLIGTENIPAMAQPIPEGMSWWA